MRRVLTIPLARDAYAAYGDVIARANDAGLEANQGTARRWDWLADLENLRPGAARANVGVFRCSPLDGRELDVRLLERHPESTQIFVPMVDARFLVVVALGGDEPDLDTLRAFGVDARTLPAGISYRPGVWHHPMVALERPIDFCVIAHESASDTDTQICAYGDPPVRIDVGF